MKGATEKDLVQVFMRFVDSWAEWDLHFHFMLSSVTLIWLKQNITLHVRIPTWIWGRQLSQKPGSKHSLCIEVGICSQSQSTFCVFITAQWKQANNLYQKNHQEKLSHCDSQKFCKKPTENDSTQIPKVVSESTTDANTEPRCFETSWEGLK